MYLFKIKKMEDLPYWIYEEKLIFKPEFNQELKSYYELILQHNTLIFSNYEESEITIKTKNKYERKYKKFYKDSLFNKEIKLTNNLKSLTLEEVFDQPLKLNKGLESLTL